MTASLPSIPFEGDPLSPDKREFPLIVADVLRRLNQTDVLSGFVLNLRRVWR
ncbi:MAG: hypothetical protein RID09_22315 [Coleofasciculus sp. G1-WW12-02]|uniref:hypothetical protein n=1 Tax=Coleofasciculus sp. G1-WW12-02 TaxID=3068483 RepID=UPI003300CFD8